VWVEFPILEVPCPTHGSEADYPDLRCGFPQSLQTHTRAIKYDFLCKPFRRVPEESIRTTRCWLPAHKVRCTLARFSRVKKGSILRYTSSTARCAIALSRRRQMVPSSEWSGKQTECWTFPSVLFPWYDCHCCSFLSLLSPSSSAALHLSPIVIISPSNLA
jgi:hypothetical protein